MQGVFDGGFVSMVAAMKFFKKYPDVDFVYPIHLNPNVRKPIHEVFGENLCMSVSSLLNCCGI